MMRSLRSKLILASIVGTGGLLLFMHMMMMFLLIHVAPGFRGSYSPIAVYAAVAFMVAGIMFVRRALTPFFFLRQGLTSVRLGQSHNVEGAYPSEVQPLVDELNALLQDRENAVKRAYAAAGDLAHGLKTPLAVLAQEADKMRAAGQKEMADSVAYQVERMSRQMNYHLARARTAASGPAGAAQCNVALCADGLIRALVKLHAGREIDVSSKIDRELGVRLRVEDLEEILGNLLDNACKWARSRVVLAGTQEGDLVVLTVDDDGPGLATELRTVVLARGVRMDETTAGTGLGLAIVRDLIELYGGALWLEDSPLGGLRACVSVPRFE